MLVPEALADFIDAKNEGGATLFNAAIKIATNNKNKEGKHYRRICNNNIDKQTERA